MKNKFCQTLLLLAALSLHAVAQNRGVINGKITDQQTGDPLGYATVSIFQASDNKLVTGNISNEKGEFKVDSPYGELYATVEFVGYQKFTTDQFTLQKNEPKKSLGTLSISPSANALREVEVRAEKSTMELSLDKRIFNVGKDLANAGGTASDVLMNIPSVSVEPDGGIKLRGSSNVRILIDGKPSGLVSMKGGAGLQALQANMIERVEIITNPSARYEAEGMAGILNIILKKEKKQGFNGSVDLITGYPVNQGVGLNLNYRHKKVNFFINYGLAYRIAPNIATTYQEVFESGEKLISEQGRDGTVTGFNNNIRGGLDYYFSESSILTASYLFKRSDAFRETNLVYDDYVGSLNNKIRTTNRRQEETEDEPNSEYTVTFKKDFKRKEHSFTASTRYIDNWERSDQTFFQEAFAENGSPDLPQTFLQKSLNDEFEKNLIVQADYVQPIGKDGKFETGLRSSFRNMVNDFFVKQRNEQGIFENLPGFTNYFIYNENIHAWYGILGNKSNKLTYQAGLRAEWTDVKTTLRATNEINPRRYANLFPSIHTTYNFTTNDAVQISYSRRIRRPFYNDLSPFWTLADIRNFSSGNPNLNPEFTNSFELGHIKYMEIGSLSSSIYFRDTKDKIQSIRSVDGFGFATSRPENLTGERSYGAELINQMDIRKWWKSDFSFNFFRADIDGTNIDENFKRKTYSWFTRYSSRFTVTKGFDLQLRANYEAPQKTVQGRRLSLAYLDLAANKDIFKGKGSLNLSILDVFNSRVYRFVVEGDTFLTNGRSQYRMRQANLTLNYRFNNGKREKSLID